MNDNQVESVSRRKVLISGAAVAAAAIAAPAAVAAEKSEAPEKGANIKFGLGVGKKKKEAAPASRFQVFVDIKNESSLAMVEARFGLSDDDCCEDPVVTEIRFGRINPGARERKTSTLPSGIEKVLYTMKMEDGQEYSNLGLGNNAPGVELVITD